MATGEESRILLLGLGVPCYNIYRRLRGVGYISFAGVDFSGRYLRQANLSSVDLHSAKFRGTDLRYASLWGANACGTDFTGADLRGADLFRASMSESILWRARMQGANLGGANFEGAQGMTRQDFERWIKATCAFAGKEQHHNFHMRLLLQGRSFEEWVEAMRSSITFDDSA